MLQISFGLICVMSFLPLVSSFSSFTVSTMKPHTHIIEYNKKAPVHLNIEARELSCKAYHYLYKILSLTISVI